MLAVVAIVFGVDKEEYMLLVVSCEETIGNLKIVACIQFLKFAQTAKSETKRVFANKLLCHHTRRCEHRFVLTLHH